MRYIMRTCIGREEYAAYMRGTIDGLIELRDVKKDPVGNFVSALEAAGNYPCVHLEDDAILTDNFAAKAESIISDRPDMVCQFFSMRKADTEVGSRIEKGSTFIATLCFYVPAGMNRGLRAFFPKWDRWHEHPTGYDLTVADFLKKTKQDYYIHCPNLADHRVGKSAIAARRSSRRVSQTFRQ